MLEAVDVIGCALAGVLLADVLKWLGGVALAATQRSWEADADWRTRSAAQLEVVYAAGNALPDENVARRRVAVPALDAATNALTSVGFLAMSLRVAEGARLSEAEYDFVNDKIEAASRWMTAELQLCGECRRWGGVHAVECAEVASSLRMGGDDMMYEHVDDVSRGDGAASAPNSRKKAPKIALDAKST